MVMNSSLHWLLWKHLLVILHCTTLHYVRRHITRNLSSIYIYTSFVSCVCFKDGTYIYIYTYRYDIENHHETMCIYIYKLVCMHGCVYMYIYICVHMGSRSHGKYETQGKETMIH